MKTNPAASASAEPPVTVRGIARLAGVSQMTVSRALGNRPRVAEKTRQKIIKLAQGLGYRPDPEITKLMNYMRTGKRVRFQSVICGITNWPAGTKPPYFEALLAGAERQAQSRGYGFSVLRFALDGNRPARLQRMLQSRGVEGVLLLPQRSSLDLSTGLDWRKFSVVAASMTVLGPDVNRAAPHHFANTIHLCRQLTALGYRRIGLVIDAAHDSRVNHGFSAAVESHGRHEASESVPPLVFQGSLRESLASWFRREQPDAVVATAEDRVLECARLLRLKIPGPVGFASTSIKIAGAGTPLIAGMDELPAEIGATCVDLLASMMERRIRGLPVSPASTLLAGRWRAGLSCPARR